MQAPNRLGHFAHTLAQTGRVPGDGSSILATHVSITLPSYQPNPMNSHCVDDRLTRSPGPLRLDLVPAPTPSSWGGPTRRRHIRSGWRERRGEEKQALDAGSPQDRPSVCVVLGQEPRLAEGEGCEWLEAGQPLGGSVLGALQIAAVSRVVRLGWDGRAGRILDREDCHRYSTVR